MKKNPKSFYEYSILSFVSLAVLIPLIKVMIIIEFIMIFGIIILLLKGGI